MSNLTKQNTKSFIIHPILFSIYPIIFIFSQNIHLLPVTEIFLPIAIMLSLTGFTIFILGKKINNKNKIALVISLLVIVFFSYGHVYNILNDSEFENSEISRHRYLLIPFAITAVLGTIYFLKSKKFFNNATTIANGISASIIVIISINIVGDFSSGNFYGNPESIQNEAWFGIGVPQENLMNDIFSDVEERVTIKNEWQGKENLPDIYYIILDEYPNNESLKKNYGFDNTEFLTFLENSGFYVVNNSFSNYPTTIQSLSSSLNMEYLDVLTTGVDVNSENYHLLNKLLSDNVVMQKFSLLNYEIINIGSIWGPNGEFKNATTNLCEFKEVNFDSLVRELLEKSMISYFYERHFEQLRRDQIMCEFNEFSDFNNKTNQPKFVFAHFLLPHAPYIFGPNGEHVTPGNSLNSEPWNERNAHINQVKFLNKNLTEKIIPGLLDSNNKPIIILQGDTGSGHSIDWKDPTKEMIFERMANLNVVYFPDSNYEEFYDEITPVNTFRIIFNKYFDEKYELHDDKNFWSDGEKPYFYKDVSKILN
ncbi:MAG: hypothetical protein CL763_08360 [Chloroflexi bacterium]|nr:hypothetical protein [Chloroflexota bacterium]|tara:strand:+ start:24517 stop:26127 length:1611 start_codon:yes stop_codon:yes gene_type:complete